MIKKWILIILLLPYYQCIAQKNIDPKALTQHDSVEKAPPQFGRRACTIPTAVTVFNNSPINALVTLSETDGTGKGHPIKSGEIVQFNLFQSVNVIKVRGQPQLSNYNSVNDFRPLLYNVPYELKCANSFWEIYQRGAGGDTIFAFEIEPVI